MKTLTIRGLPDEVHEALKTSAVENRRSLNQEVIAQLANGTKKSSARVDAILQAADKIRQGMVRPLTGEEIRRGIEEGRK